MKFRPAVPLWEHQKQAVKRLWRDGSCLLWHDVGTGKTRSAVTYASARVAAGEVYRVLVVGPLASVGVWEEEFRAQGWRNILTRNDVDRLADVPKMADKLPAPCVVIVTYQTISKHIKFFTNRWQPELVIIDESQAMRYYRSQRTRRLLALARSAPYRVLLSGTPAPNGYIDLFWQSHAIQPGALAANMQEFRSRYCIMGGYYNKEVIGYRNSEELAERIARIAHRVDKDVLNLPPVIDQTVPIALDPQAKRAYRTMEDELIWELEDGNVIDAGNPLVLLTRLMQITGGHLDGQPIGQQPKLQALEELIGSYPSDEKLVVFAHYLPEIKAIVNRLRKVYGARSVGYITGQVSGGKRDDLIRRFQSKPQPRIIVIQTQAGGISITLTAASTAIYYSLDYNSETYEQSRGRIHRGTQKRTCHYIHLLGKDTIDETIFRVLKAKMTRQQALGEMVKALMRGRRVVGAS